MLFLSSHFKSHRDAVIAILKHFQNATRTLQAICNHVKVIQDVALNASVPLMKRSLEIILFHVKGALADNGIPLHDVSSLARSSIVTLLAKRSPRDLSDEAEEDVEEPDELNSDEEEDVPVKPRKVFTKRMRGLVDNDTTMGVPTKKKAGYFETAARNANPPSRFKDRGAVRDQQGIKQPGGLK